MGRIELTPEEVERKYGKGLSKSYLTIVDEEQGVVEIFEKCRAKGCAEWSLINRLRSSELIKHGWIEGKTLIMRTELGKGEVRLYEGTHGLEKVEVGEDKVYTTWCSKGHSEILWCLPQARGVIKSIYHPDEGGVRRVTVITPKYTKLIAGVDDTGEKTETWECTLKAAFSLASDMKGLLLLAHRVFQASKDVPWKTSHNCSSVMVFAVPPWISTSDVINGFIERLKKCVYSENACAVFFRGVLIPKILKNFGDAVKMGVVDELEALKLAKKLGLVVAEITGTRGVIGAMAGIGYADRGIECAAYSNDIAIEKVRFRCVEKKCEEC
ncbi:hypothetical protein [Archaeoglobus veneficus]|uniref:DUF1743 domain-containing protein n=1 Tax=Archaeoglobus veneficus (strain DSM 11195 / SNP6) TaxID=693661 RepID=F2KNS1_ARCVS|nr:hypothetical protein [Archaeoglobus veneficus]AEA47398.1 hypothetical protein Arcve_1394 [Archaeoglobus veneficus SNP6]